MASDTIQTTEAKFRDNPDAARSAPTVTGRLADGRAELTSGNFTWHADLPPALGGTGSAPSPTQLLLGALAGCAVAFIHDTLGPQLGVQVDDVTATARCRADARGLLGMEGGVPDLTDIELTIEIVSPAPAEERESLHRAWLERCPIYLALLKSNDVTVRSGQDT